MTQEATPDDVLAQAFGLYIQHGSWVLAAQASGIPESTIRRRVARARSLGLKPFIELSAQVRQEVDQVLEAWRELDQDVTATAAKVGLSRPTVQRRIEQAGMARLLTEEEMPLSAPPIVHAVQQGDSTAYDLRYSIPEGLTSRGDSVLYGPDDEIRQTWHKLKPAGREPEDAVKIPNARVARTATLFDAQGKVSQQWVTEKAEDQQRELVWREMAVALAEELPKAAPTAPILVNNEDLLNFIPLGDPHVGMYAWAEETGNDFDLVIAQRDLCGAVAHLVESAPLSKRTIICNIGDFYHADSLLGITPKSGHILDMDTRMQKVVRVGLTALRKAIGSALERSEFVDVFCIPGNHDPMLGVALAIFLAHIYENEPRVIIHDQPTLRHYFRHGRVLLGMVHGDKTKDSDLPGIMATERPEDWGAAKFRYWFRGHHHQDRKTEYNGCLVEQIRTLSPGDAYSVGGGWLSGRDMKCITYHRSFGEVARSTCSIDLLRHLQQQDAA